MDLQPILTPIITMVEAGVVIVNILLIAESFTVLKSMTVIKLGDTHQIQAEVVVPLEQVKGTNPQRMR